MILLRRQLGEVLRRHRLRQGLTLRELSIRARVSLGYLSEIERGQKEASSELLTSICAALDIPLSSVLLAVSDELALVELADSGVTVSPVSRSTGSHTAGSHTAGSRPAGSRPAGSHPAGSHTAGSRSGGAIVSSIGGPKVSVNAA